ncbi:MAG: hypothetical protein HY961_00245 [Ignavibacteriae bacterium]|nr:hypothetical protein [Ignavibacteriota bacterium]
MFAVTFADGSGGEVSQEVRDAKADKWRDALVSIWRIGMLIAMDFVHALLYIVESR